MKLNEISTNPHRATFPLIDLPVLKEMFLIMETLS